MNIRMSAQGDEALWYGGVFTEVTLPHSWQEKIFFLCVLFVFLFFFSVVVLFCFLFFKLLVTKIRR